MEAGDDYLCLSYLLRSIPRENQLGSRARGPQSLLETGQDSLTVALNIQALLMAEDFPGGIRIPASKMLVNPRGQPSNKEEGLLAAWE